ncbi:hypothetical protein Emed_006924 [Eimeria media]
MDSALSFERVWVRLVRSQAPTTHGGQHSQLQHNDQPCDCVARPLLEGQSPPEQCSNCLFVAAEIGVTDTVADLKSMLLELLPSCFHTNYNLLLHRRPHSARKGEEPQGGPLLLRDSCSFADLSLDPSEVIDLVTQLWDQRSSLLHLRRLSEVLYDPKSIVMRQLPDAADPCGAFGSLLRPVVLQQVAAAAAAASAASAAAASAAAAAVVQQQQQQDGGHVSLREEACSGSVSASTSGSSPRRKGRSNKGRMRREKGRLKENAVSSWSDTSQGVEADTVLDDCSLFLATTQEPLESLELQRQQMLQLQQSLLPSPLKAKPKLLSSIRVYPGGLPTAAAQLAGHVLWLTADTLEGRCLCIAATERGFCVSSIHEQQGQAPSVLTPGNAFPLYVVTTPNGQTLPIKEATSGLLFDTLAQLLCAYSKAFADGVHLLAPEPLDADLPLHALPSVQPFLPPFSASTDATLLERNQLSEPQTPPFLTNTQWLLDESLDVSRRRWVEEVGALSAGQPNGDFAQRIAYEKTASKLYAEFQEAALSGTMALRERRLSPIGCEHGKPLGGEAKATSASQDNSVATAAPQHVFLHNHILMVADSESSAFRCKCTGETPSKSAEACAAIREELRHAANAAEMARLCEDEKTAAAAAAAAAVAASVTHPDNKALLQHQQHCPSSGIVVLVDYAGTRTLCQGVREDALLSCSSPELSLTPGAATTSSSKQQLQPSTSATEGSLLQEGVGRLSPLDVISAPYGLNQSAAELAAAAAAAAARHTVLPRGDAAVAAAVAAVEAVDLRVKSAAAEAGLTEGPSHAAACPHVRPELLRSFLLFQRRQQAHHENKRRKADVSRGEGEAHQGGNESEEPPTLENELTLRFEHEIRRYCSSSTKELLHGGSWFGADCKGGITSTSSSLQRLQQLTLECCTDTVLRCLEKAKEQQEAMLESRRAEIDEFREAVKRQVERREMSQQAREAEQRRVKSGEQQTEDKGVTRTDIHAEDKAQCAQAAEAASTPKADRDRNSDIAILSLLGNDVSLLQDDCDLPARAAAAAKEACSLAFPPWPADLTSDCLMLGVGKETLPLDSERINQAETERLLQLGEYLRQVAVPLVARLLSSHFPESNPPLDSQSLKAFLHRYGLNCRHLGAVYRAVETLSDNAEPSLSFLLLERDILLRCAKSHINWHLSDLTIGEVGAAVAHLISCLFSPFFSPTSSAATAAAAAAATTAATATAAAGPVKGAPASSVTRESGLKAVLAQTPEQFWKALRCRAWTRFGRLLPESPLQSIALRSTEGRLVLLRSLCASLGVQLRTDVAARLLQQQPIPKWMLLLHGAEQRQSNSKAQHRTEMTFPRVPLTSEENNLKCGAGNNDREEAVSRTEGTQQGTQQVEQLSAVAAISCTAKSSRLPWLVYPEDVVGITPVIKGAQLPSQTARALLAVASHCSSSGHVDAAVDLLQQALCVAHQLSGAVCSEAATCYAAIGQLLGLLDDPLNGCNNLLKSLILLERCNGPDHPGTIEVHSALAHAFSKLPGEVYRMRSLCHMQRALLLLHTWSGGLNHPMLPLLLVGASRCSLQQHQQMLQADAKAQQLQETADVAMRCARAAEAALEDMKDLNAEYRAEVYCELSWIYESLRDWRRALDWARAARGEYVKANVDARTTREAEARMVRLTRALVIEAQQHKLHQQQREVLVSRLRHAAELKRFNNKAGATALLATADREAFEAHSHHGLTVGG